MNISIKALGSEPFAISNEIPEGLSGHHIPGSKILYAVATFGEFIIQFVDLGEYAWAYYYFDLKESVTFLITYPASLSFIRTSLKGHFHFELKSFLNILVEENQCKVLCLAESNNRWHLEAGEYVIFETAYTSNTIIQSLKFFPVFEEFKINVNQFKAALLCKQQICLSATIADCVYKVIHSPFSENVRQFHINAVKDLLGEALKEATRLQPCNNNFTVDDVERIYEAKSFIDAHIPTHYSIGQIARRVGMNEKKLKYGFKEIFNSGLYAYFLDRVLEIARIEIEQTRHSVKEIALRTGYKNANNLSAAFQKKFGVPPLKWRRRFNSKVGKHFE